MAKNTTANPVASTVHTPAPAVGPAAQTWPPDEYTGIGGSYTRNPTTGVRTPVSPLAPAAGTDTAAA